MSGDLFFSVIVPLYNKKPHIARAIRSVLGQTYGNFELIVIDDASTDGSMDVVREFADPRLTLLCRDAPGPGGYAARNHGIRNASGEWIAFLDADDEWLANHLERMKALSERFPSATILGAGWTTDNGRRRSADRYYGRFAQSGCHALSTGDYLRCCIRGERPVHTSVAAVRRHSAPAEGLFPAHLKAMRGGDLHAWLTMVCESGKIAWSDHIGAVYHTDSVNMVTRKSPSGPHLMSREIYRGLASHCDRSERRLLRKYLNRRLRSAWATDRLQGGRAFGLFRKLYWPGDLWFATLSSLISFLPRGILDLALRRRFRSGA